MPKILILLMTLSVNLVFAEDLSEEDERKIVMSADACTRAYPGASRTSSNDNFMGIGGPKGRACKGKELFWRAGDHFHIMCFKNVKGKIQNLGAGLAQFSPDCKSFFTNTFEGVGIFDAETGKKVRLVKGDNPLWAADSKSLYLQRENKKLVQLVHHQAKSGAEKILDEAKDLGFCHPPGEGVMWQPPEISGDEISWSYVASSKPPASYQPPQDGSSYRPTKKTTLSLKTGKVLKTEWVPLECETD